MVYATMKKTELTGNSLCQVGCVQFCRHPPTQLPTFGTPIAVSCTLDDTEVAGDGGK